MKSSGIESMDKMFLPSGTTHYGVVMIP